MLVIKPYVNYTPIDDEIWVQNVEDCPNDIYRYIIRKPEGFEHIDIYHKRTDGWRILTIKALEVLERSKDE
jgi:hypothetical protein